MALLALAIVASVAAGVWAEGRYGTGALELSRRILDAMLYAALPFIVFFILARAELTAGAGVGLLLGYASLALVGAVAYVLAAHVLKLPASSAAMVVIAAIMGNTGFLGAPVVATLLGHDDLGAAITYDALVSGPMFFVVAFAVAAAFTTRGQSVRVRMRTYLLRNPPLIAVAAALVAPDALAPDVLVDIARYLLLALAPLGFFVAGVQLATERIGFPPPLSAAVAVVVALRIGLAPLLLLGLAAAAAVDMPDAYLMQAAMPVGVNTLVVAHAYDLDRGLAAAAFGWSTAIALATGLVAAALV
ncbi:MAG TPA: AEC family transporter [Solirubrobacteraceae bacterium]|nr:AEC family transporter [Solirubrobacteraceae bacterium]